MMIGGMTSAIILLSFRESSNLFQGTTGGYLIAALSVTLVSALLSGGLLTASNFLEQAQQKYRMTTLTQVYWLSTEQIKVRTQWQKGQDKPKIILSGLTPVISRKMKHIITQKGATRKSFSKSTNRKNRADFVQKITDHVYIPAIMEAIEAISLENRNRQPKDKTNQDQNGEMI